MRKIIKITDNKYSNKLLSIVLGFGFISLLAIVSCDDIFEEDITDDEIFLLAPASGVSVKPDSTITFAWDFIDGATEYQIQIVEPTFDAAGLLYFDSVTTQNKVNFSLPPGAYEWAVRGLNNGYSTSFFINDFIVEDTSAIVSDITDEIRPLTPRGLVESAQVFFWWEELDNATEYQLQVVTPDFNSPTQLFYDTIVSDIGVKLSLEPGVYSWRIKGINEQSESPFQSLSFEVSEGNAGNAIQLLRPLESFRTNAINLAFSWRPVENVDFYVLNIDGLDQENIITDNNAIAVAIDGGNKTYQWSVTAITNNQETYFSDTLSFSYSGGAPAAPSLAAPLANASVSGDVDFSWIRSLDSILGDSLFVYDAGMNLLPDFPKYSQTENFTGIDLTAGEYSWQVKSVDEDNRVGDFSELRTLSVE